MSASTASSLSWYARRLGRMSPAEIAWRIRDQAVRRAWVRRQIRPEQVTSLPPAPTALPVTARRFTSALPGGSALRASAPEEVKGAILADAERLLKGEWEVLGVVRTDMEQPDWFYDPVTGRRSVPEAYAFDLDQRDETTVGNVKQVWEVNRLQHLTLLAVAWHLTGEDAYADRVARQLRSWWRENPFLSGINWTSGIELGIRLINLVWVRRLLDGWPGIEELFERDDMAVRQIYWHQQYLDAFESRGSSANNHVIAEAAGQLVAACAFPWFAESERWRRDSARLFERELARNTFVSGINRELATDYHGFVAELGFIAALEAAVAGTPLGGDTWKLLCAMADCMAALVDQRVQPPRQGDSDEGRVLLLDAPRHNRWPELLALGDALFRRLDWWPETTPSLGSVLASAMLAAAEEPSREVTGRPSRRPCHFPNAGISILRTDTAISAEPEIWCRCDGGPHGFLSIAAHAHADALSLEVRYGGVDILADPGTYSYHGEPEWRSYFRSTVAHNTAEIGGRSQSDEGGPFMWLRHAQGSEVDVSDVSWTAEHDGYASLRPIARHRRSVRLDRTARNVEIHDVIDDAGHCLRLAFHFGPRVEVRLEGSHAVLTWSDEAAAGSARMSLPNRLRWSLHRGETSPILGWYSPGLGQRTAAYTLLGSGRHVKRTPLITRLEFMEARGKDSVPISSQAPSSWLPEGRRGYIPGSETEAP